MQTYINPYWIKYHAQRMHKIQSRTYFNGKVFYHPFFRPFIFQQYLWIKVFLILRIDDWILRIDYSLRVPKNCVKSVRIRSFSGPNARKYRPEKLRIRTLFTQWSILTDKKFKVNPFQDNVPFLYSLETSKILMFPVGIDMD